jgi:hypothetical protein
MGPILSSPLGVIWLTFCTECFRGPRPFIERVIRAMPHRQFVDAGGFSWSVWDVRPATVQPQSRDDADPSGEVQVRSPSHVAPIDQALAAGWLCFECGEQKRRLAPIPPGWEAFSTDALEQLCRSAPPVQRKARGQPRIEPKRKQA